MDLLILYSCFCLIEQTGSTGQRARSQASVEIEAYCADALFLTLLVTQLMLLRFVPQIPADIGNSEITAG